jgi:hypothetical protein
MDTIIDYREKRLRVIRKNMTTQQVDTIKYLIALAKESEGVDITERSRMREIAYARKAYMWVAKNKWNLSYSQIGWGVGVLHDTTAYHIRTAQQWIDNKDLEFMKLIDKIYDTNLCEKEDFKATLGRLEPFWDVLREIPEGMEAQVQDRLKLFLKTLKMTHEDKCEHITANGIAWD